MTTEFTVADMNCNGCEEAIEDALDEVSGVETADADHEAGRVTVEGDADRDALVGAIEDAGFTVSS